MLADVCFRLLWIPVDFHGATVWTNVLGVKAGPVRWPCEVQRLVGRSRYAGAGFRPLHFAYAGSAGWSGRRIGPVVHQTLGSDVEKDAEDRDRLNIVNAHVLNAVLGAGRKRAVVAARDIFDERGIKLLAQDKPVTEVLHERLLGRRLRVPLEASLRIEAGIDRAQLRTALVALLDSGHVVASLVRPWAGALDAQMSSLPLDPVVQFLLTAMQSTTPRAFEHAVQAMALSGAMAARSDDSVENVRLAMVCGLLHDLGELYLDPELRGDGRGLDLRQYRALVTHPRLAELLLSRLPLYPAALHRAIGEHHERLDGSGYARMRSGAGLSRLGRMLAVVETALGVLCAPDVPLERASFALRVVPGEYDSQWVGLVASAAAATREPPLADETLVERAWDGLARSGQRMEQARRQAVLLASDASEAVRTVAQRALHLLDRLRAGWNEMGLWVGVSPRGAGAQELVMADEELRYRLLVMERDCVWQASDLDEEQTLRLTRLWQSFAA